MQFNSVAPQFGRHHVDIYDTTLRDGEQAPLASMTPQEKRLIANALGRMGVNVLEIGFPSSSPEEFKACQQIARDNSTPDSPTITVLSRCVPHDIDTAWLAVQEAAHTRVHLWSAVSDGHITYKLRTNRQTVLNRIEESLSHAKAVGFDDIQFGLEDATRADFNFLKQCIETAVKHGAKVITVADTVGTSTPEEYGALIHRIETEIPVIKQQHITIATHCHNDLGLATANTLSGVMAGATQVETTMNGLGERAGNAAEEQVALTLRLKEQYDADTTIDTQLLYPTSQLVSSITTHYPVEKTRPIVGENAFKHESGIHQAGIISKPALYESYAPSLVGRNHQFTFGPRSGWAGVQYQLNTVLRLRPILEKSDREPFMQLFTQQADEQRQLSDEQLMLLHRHYFAQTRGGLHVLRYALQHFQAQCRSALATLADWSRSLSEQLQRAAGSST